MDRWTKWSGPLSPPHKVDVVQYAEHVHLRPSEQAVELLIPESQQGEQARYVRVRHHRVEAPPQLLEHQRLHLEHADFIEADVHVLLYRLVVKAHRLLKLDGYRLTRVGHQPGGERAPPLFTHTHTFF